MRPVIGRSHSDARGSAGSQVSEFDIHALLEPSAFSHSVDAIRLTETHVSWVVLTGPFVYKIKKPLKLDFIDASTLERRRFLCEEELRLNRRLAADLYVDVVPIVATEGALRMDSSGSAIEYAVRMKQFDAKDELGSLLERRDIAREDVERLAELLYRFHTDAAHPSSSSNAPISQRILRTIAANLADLEAAIPTLLERSTFEELAAWIGARIESTRPVLEQREKLGFVRECHGDLHAGNVVRYGGRLVPFDCLEFNADLRWLDVLDDVAFLVMDLASHAREDLAFALLSRYLECSGDYRGIALMRFYATHRALVRAKVDGLSARTLQHRQAEFGERFDRRIRAARSWMDAKTPILLLMHGVSGSGKSWLSERLVGALPAIRLRSDLERKRLGGLDTQRHAGDELQSGLYSQAFTRKTYERLQDYAEVCLRCGFTTIVDATLLDARERSAFFAIADRLAAPVAIVACSSDPSVLAERIRARARSGDRVSDADTRVLAAQLESLQPFSRDEDQRVIKVNTSEPDAVEKVVRGIQARLAK